MTSIQKYVLVVLALLTVACSSSGSSTSSSTELASAGAMVAAAFSSSASSSLNQIVIRRAGTEGGGDTNTCEVGDGGPSNVTTALTGTAGTYGSASDSVTITDTSSQFCASTDGTVNENPSDLLFATFTVSEATVTCSDGSTATMAGSGIWRNRDDLGFFPQIYGTFTITTSDGSGEADCSIALNEDSTVNTASCSDSSGNSVSLNSDITCTIDAGDEAVPSDPAGENG